MSRPAGKRPAEDDDNADDRQAKKVKGESASAVGTIRLTTGSGMRFIGQLNNQGEPHGEGAKYRADGSEYASGQWRDGKLHGRGKRTDSDGDRYEGDFVDDKFSGLGMHTRADGRVYEGEFQENASHGLGVVWDNRGTLLGCGRCTDGNLVELCAVPTNKIPVGAFLSAQAKGAPPERTLLLPDGGHFVGDFGADFKPHGEGTKYRADGSEESSGQWRDGKLHGRGKRSCPDGDLYEGDFVANTYWGMGTYTWANGRIYEGDFPADASSGLGVEWTAKGKVAKCGRWADDELVESRPVPRSKIPVGSFLSAAARAADPERTLLMPHGGHFVGEFNTEFRPHGEGVEFAADGSEVASGHWCDGKLHGRGKRTDSDGDRYEGDFVDDKFSGLGALTWVDGGVFEGEWADGLRSGFGMQWDKDGEQLDCGHWADDLVDTRTVPRSKISVGMFLSAAARVAPVARTLLMPTGGHYVGEFNADFKPHGEGTKYHADGSEVASGQWRDGKQHGCGKRTEPYGNRYEGDFVDGHFCGVGTFTWPNGVVHEGEWADSKRNGLGVKWSRDGAPLHCGCWENNKFVESRPVPRSKIPIGTLLPAAARAADPRRTLFLPVGGHFVGEFNADFKPHGEGTKYRANGSEVASGQWRDGKLHGRGKTVCDGGRYEGEFVAGQMSGLGAFTWPDGNVYEGEFRKGDFGGFGVQWTAEGEVSNCGWWADDQLVESRPVPRSKIPVGKCLSAAARVAPVARTLLLPDGGHFVGEFNADFKPHGEGTKYHADGSEVASGQWRDGKQHGRGQMIFSNGDCYEGGFVDGESSGLGAYTWADGAVYDGEWAEGDFNGFGIKWNEGKVLKCGRFENDELVETRSVPRSKLPVGSIRNAAANDAALLYPDGRFYRGEINDQFERHGRGSMHAADGTVQSEAGDWTDDVFCSAALVPSPDPIASAGSSSSAAAAAPAAAAPTAAVSWGRKALLIGNNKYAKPQNPLKCCCNDAADMRDALAKLGFECTLLLDATHRQMTDVIHDFIDTLQPNDTVFIHFSGHGEESHGRTYLIPVDFGSGRLRDNAVCLEDLQHDLNEKNCNLINILMLDCCRYDKKDGTFRGAGHRSSAAPRASGDSFARKPTSGQFLVAYSSDRGTVAHESSKERNGWFTACVLSHLTTPGLHLEQIFKRANRDLKAKSNHAQRSWIHLTMDDDVILRESV